MPLKNNWTNKTNDVDDILAEDINIIAGAVIEIEENNKVDKAPYIGDNGNWFEWDSNTETFVDTGVKAEGTGEDGYTPQKGVDYWTEEDKAEIAEDVAPFVVNFSKSDDGTITADKTIAAIEEAYKAQKATLGFLTYTETTNLGWGESASITFTEQFYYVGGTTFVKPRQDSFSQLSCNILSGEWKLNTYTLATKTYVDEQVGDIETALDSIINIQNQLMGVSE